MKMRTKWLLGFAVVSASVALVVAQPPSRGGFGASGFGRGGSGRGARAGRGGGGGGFVTASYDKTPPEIPADVKAGGVLIYSKTNGFREEASITGSSAALAAIAHERHWPYFVTENAAVMNKEQLAKFKLVIWNNNSGDTLTEDQRAAFKAWVEDGGSYVGIHGAGGDPIYATPNGHSSLADWKWYVDTLVGAQFVVHSRIQPGEVHVDDPKSPLTKGLPPVFKRSDEWYSFSSNPRSKPGFHILLTVDEKSYTPGPATMGEDHPLAWWHCVGKGHAFYSALGHGGGMYAEPVILQLYGNAMAWGLAESGHSCAAAK